jgi:hypothetical protein
MGKRHFKIETLCGYSIIFALNTSSIYTTLIKDLIVYIRIAVEYPIIKGWGGIPLTG